MITETAERLKARGIRPSRQRVALYDYLSSVRTHPTVDDVFTALRPALPTLSRTTVYSTMRLFVGKGLAQELRTDEGELRYDGFTHFHAHFKCRGCGGVYDIDVPGRHTRLYVTMPEGFVEDSEHLTYYGFCPTCSEKKIKTKQQPTTRRKQNG
ncbi:MAG: Fur family transcriptional regulator [Kiritimatiellia bacterium]